MTEIEIAGRNAVNLTGWSKHTPIERTTLHGGVQYLFRFPNSYGASLINHSGSYGNEIAVIMWDGTDYDLTYDTPVTADVLGWLSVEEIESTLDAIATLPSRSITYGLTSIDDE
jgi:hypothetical protein